MKIGELSLQQIEKICGKHATCIGCPLMNVCGVLEILGTDFNELTFQLSGYLDKEVNV